MERLTAPRCSGIKSGYWSTAKKDELVQHLGVTRKTVYNWMAHGSIPQSKLVMMSDLFHCSIDYLLEREPKA